MRSIITSTIVRAIASETGAALPEAQQPVPSAETVAAIVNADKAEATAKRAKQRAAREAKADKPATAKPANAKPGKPGKAAASAKPAERASAVTEAKPDPRAAKQARIAADRTNVAALYAGFEKQRASVPVKPLSAFKPATTSAHPMQRNPSIRQAAAIATAFAAANVKLADGAKAPRVFEHCGVRSCIENGAMRDAVSSGLIRVSGSSPETETLTIAPKQAAAIVGLLGATILKSAKLI